MAEWTKLQADEMNNLVKFTAPFDLSGIPTLTMPCGIDSRGAPIALQLVAPAFSEDLLCRIGCRFQNVTAWHKMHPQDLQQ
jgi:amidase